MAHKSRVACMVIDCQTNDLTDACHFWSGALGVAGSVDDDGKYAVLDMPANQPRVLLQRVDHAPRVHLDIESDDRDAEARRLEALGARCIGVVRSWLVMEAPTGHRFCIVAPQREDFNEEATTWGSAP